MLRGGPASKIGHRYETWWTVCELLRMLRGETEDIRIEPPGIDKTEFVVTTSRHREYHQVKYSHPNGKWSLAALRSEGILQFAFEALNGTIDRFVFVSGSGARELSELVDAARSSASVEEFEHKFLGADQRKKKFELLCTWWRCSASIAIGILNRIYVRTIDEIGLERDASLATMALFIADNNKIISELRSVVTDSVHRTISRESLSNRLAEIGYGLRRVRTPSQAIPALEQATEHYLKLARRRLIQRTLVANDAVEMILDRLSTTDCVVTGRAGSGKTACVIEIADALHARSQPVLAFRIDRISSSTTMTLGEELGLEESPVLVLAAAAEVTGRPGVLIVDQLDAVSTASGRSSAAFDLVERLIQEVKGAGRRIQIVIVCRTFDWNNDSRLRGVLSAKPGPIEVAEFQIEQVKQFLNQAGFDSLRFHERQLALLRLPQNLALFLESGFSTSSSPKFDNTVKLFDAYWLRKRQAAAGPDNQDHWLPVIETICSEMNAKQQLWVSREKLDCIPPHYLDRLVSEGVITLDGARYGFGHESFFDYCFARLFMARSESVVSLLTASEQHLFRRSQIRQILTYLRETDCSRYEQELGALLSDPGVRVHIKDLAFALLAEVAEPTEAEWRIWEEWVAERLYAIEHGLPERHNISSVAWRRLFRAKSWFSFIDGRRMIEKWISSGNDHLVDLAVNYLSHHQAQAPDRAVVLLSPHRDSGGKWTNRLFSFMRFARHHSRAHFELLLHLVDNGTFDKLRQRLWSILYDFCEKRPEWVPEFLSHYLNRRFMVIRDAGDDLCDSKLIGYDQSVSKLVQSVAERFPEPFVEHILPVVLRISDSSLVTEQSPRRDEVWHTFIKSDHETGEQACLLALADALTTLASDGSCTISAVVAKLRSRDTYTANYLLQAAYRGAPDRLADEAVATLLDQPWRLQCGYHDSRYWWTMELLRSVVPHCSIEVRRRLEELIIAYIDPFERPNANFRLSLIGRSALHLLSALPSAIRSDRANKKLGELERRFGKPDAEPSGVVAGPVESPISDSSATFMTDDHWRRAIKKYDTQSLEWSGPNFFIGGALQLSQVLEKCAKSDPQRFARLMLTLPTDVNPIYIEHVLNALKDAPIDTAIKLKVSLKAFDSRKHCGKSISDVLGNIKDRLPEEGIDMLCWIGTRHDDPERELWRENATSGQLYYGGDIYSNGINCTRGRAAEAIQRLIFTDAAYIERFRPTIERMVFDQSAAVRACVAGVLRAISYHNHELGMNLFLSMNFAEERLLATVYVYDFIGHNLLHEFPKMRPIVERMICSSEPEVCEVGARLASIAAMLHEAAADFDEATLRGSQRHRLGVAQVATANLGTPDFRNWCKDRLLILFNDDDPEVRGIAAQCFGRLPVDTLGTYGDLIRAFCNSAAFAEGEFWLLSALEKSTGRLPGMTCLACDRSLSTSTGDKHIAAKLIFRTYQQHQNDEWTCRSLDLIDQLCLEEPWWADRQLEEFER